MNDHIGDANKMIGGTPRTDARVRRMIAKDQSPEELKYWARELERELNAANDRIKHLIQLGMETSQYGLTKHRELWEREEKA